MDDLQLTFDRDALRREGVKYKPLPLADHTKEILLNGAKFQEGDTLDPNLTLISDQLRPLSFEAMVHIVQTCDGKFLYQQTPEIGDEHSVETWHSAWAEQRRELRRLLEIHNHPSPVDNNGLLLASNFFSPGDWFGFLAHHTLRLSAVVWDEGTAILVKGPSSEEKFKNSLMKALFWNEFRASPSRFLNFLVNGRHWSDRKKRYFTEVAWHEYWVKKWRQANADYDSDARLRINKMLAEQFGVQLVFIPRDSRDVQILVDV